MLLLKCMLRLQIVKTKMFIYKLMLQKCMTKIDYDFLPVEWVVVKRGGSKMIVIGKPICEKYNLEIGDKVTAQILRVVHKHGSEVKQI